MTLPQNVKDAVGRVDRSLREWSICQQPWQIIRAHLLSQDAEMIPVLNIRCEVQTENNIAASTYLNVVRVEQEDDGSFTAVTDLWPKR